MIAFPRNTAKSLLEAADHFQPLDRKFMIRTEPPAEEERGGGGTVARMPEKPAVVDTGGSPEPTASAGGQS